MFRLRGWKLWAVLAGIVGVAAVGSWHECGRRAGKQCC
jgi:hypothetical protein